MGGVTDLPELSMMDMASLAVNLGWMQRISTLWFGGFLEYTGSCENGGGIAQLFNWKQGKQPRPRGQMGSECPGEVHKLVY